MNRYVSSITSKYGDVENVKNDVKILNDILNRQGTSLLIDVIAENVGSSSVKFNFSSKEKHRVIEKLVFELRESINERV